MSKINLVKGLVAPDAPSTGQISIFSLTDGELYTRNDDGTIELLSGLGGLIDDPHPVLANNLDVDSNRVINLSDPITAQDAATKNYVDTEITNLGTGTLLSNIVEDTTPQLGGNLDVNGFRLTSVNDIVLNPNDNVDVMLSRIVNVSTPTDAFDAANKSYVDGLFASASMSGIDNVVEDTTPQLGGNLDAQTFRINNLGDPILAQDAASKNYVDTEIIALGLGTASQLDISDVVQTSDILTGSAMLDFGSIGANSSIDLTITVTGAVIGNAVALGLPSTPNVEVVFMAFVSAVDTVTVRAFNVSAMSVDPTSGLFNVTVFQT